MKEYILNSGGEHVAQMLEGVALANGDLQLMVGDGVQVILDRQHTKDKVAIISGGGSGHEPAHAGYVGQGMLSAAVCGNVFASPTAAAVYAAIQAVTGPPGCLLIVKNYTGDRLHFGMAAERAKLEGKQVELVVVADDCGIETSGIAGKRGIAGTVLVHKVAGALATSGADLQAVFSTASQAAKSVATMGAALSPCMLPGSTCAHREIPEGQMELGLGIHGEPGARQCDLMHADDLVATLLDSVLAALSETPLAPGTRVAGIVNNLGSTSSMELTVVTRKLIHLLAEKSIVLERLLVGSYMTALNMAGVSISLMPIDDVWLELLDADTSAPGWPKHMLRPDANKPLATVPADLYERVVSAEVDPAARSEAGHKLAAAVAAGANACIAAEEKLALYDSRVGDGDCGATMAAGAQAVLSTLSQFDFSDLGTASQQLAGICMKSMGGTSGALYELLFMAAARTLKGKAADSVVPRDFVEALSAGCEAVQRYGGASPGQRTMVDALVPAAEAMLLWADGPASECIRAGAAAANEGADGTMKMAAMAGRSSYVRPELLAEVPDPGAYAVACWMTGVSSALTT